MMTRDEVLCVVAIAAERSRAAVFVGNGYNARALCALADQREFFYMVGSMGLCPTLAAGFAHCVRMPVIAVEGDGNALMGLSGFPVASKAAPGPFVHIVLDNGLQESTGGHRGLSSHVDFGLLALGTGYEQVYHPEDVSSLETLLEVAVRRVSRTFLYVTTQTDVVHPRVPYDPQQITRRFREAISTRLTLDWRYSDGNDSAC